MAARFVDVSESQMEQFKENAVPQNTKDATKFGVRQFQCIGKLSKSFFSRNIYFQNKKVCLHFSPQRVGNF